MNYRPPEENAYDQRCSFLASLSTDLAPSALSLLALHPGCRIMYTFKKVPSRQPACVQTYMCCGNGKQRRLQFQILCMLLSPAGVAANWRQSSNMILPRSGSSRGQLRIPVLTSLSQRFIARGTCLFIGLQTRVLNAHCQ
jgi:hypothetical protein